MTYPIAEVFHSVQGEGANVGVPMTFIRFAGCNVGKPFPTAASAFASQAFKPYQERCTLWDGRQFACDTNYKKATSMTADEIIEYVYAGNTGRMLLTGGEPLIHPLGSLLARAADKGVTVLVETSGTVDIGGLWDAIEWVAVSPKQGVLPQVLGLADEIKLLVDERLTSKDLEPWLPYAAKVFLQPVNGVDSINRAAVEHCIALLHQFPDMRLSAQMHKAIGAR